jgi:hypothetical protein
MRSRTSRGATLALAGVVLIAMGALAQGVSATEEAIPPTIRLARLSGPVEVPPGDSDGPAGRPSSSIRREDSSASRSS